MFIVSWLPEAFDRMERLVRDNPDLRAEFVYALRELATTLGRAADVWGESREANYRLGYAGILSALIRLTPGTDVVEVVWVALRSREAGN